MMLASTIPWMNQYNQRYNSHERILQRFERSYDQSSDIDPEAEPVNILCLDGGGMKGKLAERLMIHSS